MGNHRPGIAIPSINPGKLAQLSTHQTPGAVPGFLFDKFSCCDMVSGGTVWLEKSRYAPW